MQIDIRNLTFEYNSNSSGKRQALHDVSFSIGENEFIGLIGCTGSGKSTLITQIDGLEKPTSGEILYDGKNIHGEKYDLRSLRFNIGMVFQYPEYQLFEETVLKDVCFGPKNKGLSDEEAIAASKKALALVGMDEECFERSPFELSGGQKRRVAIAGILAMEPKVLILDEPTAGLDPVGRNEILESIYKFYKELGITVILVSHNMNDVVKYATRVIVINEGELVRDDVPEKVFGDVSFIEKVGLEMPEITKILSALKKSGIDVNDKIIDFDEGVEEIFNLATGN